MKSQLGAALFALVIGGCADLSSSSGGDAPACSPLFAVSALETIMTASNVLPVTVGSHYINEITVSVTVCEPGTTTCQVIPKVLLDTGSNGLRLFSCSTSLNLPAQTAAGKSVAECVSYADGTSHWGAVKLADVVMGAEKASNIPIQIINPSFGTAPSSCTHLEGNPLKTGYNGILGVGLISEDCPQCVASIGTLPAYYECTGATCNASTMATNKQVVNPVARMPINNNGLILTLPAVGNSGVSTTSGTLTLGIGTASGNNTPTGAPTVLPADGNINFQTTFNSINYTASFIDSGSNALYFPSSSLVASCNISGYTFYCPASPTNLSATQKGFAGAPTKVVPFTITDANVILNSSNQVYSTYGGVMAGAFDWGLPFFFNKTIYIGIDGASTPLGTGPFWAF